MRKKVFSLILICLMMASALHGCRKIEKTDKNTETTDPTYISGDSSYDEIPLIDEDDEQSGDISIATPYVTLKYPEKWLNYLKVKKNFQDGNNVTFYTSFGDDKEVKILTVHFNEDGEFPVGVLEKSDESVYIAFSYSDLELDETWTQNEKDVVNAMQEQINYIIDALKEEPDFIPEN